MSLKCEPSSEPQVCNSVSGCTKKKIKIAVAPSINDAVRPFPKPYTRRNVKRFRGGLVFEAHRLVHHSTLGWREIEKKKKKKTKVKIPIPQAPSINDAVHPSPKERVLY